MRHYVHAMRASPGGRLVVYDRQPLADDPRFDRSASFVTAVHDLRHPQSWVDRPPQDGHRGRAAQLVGLPDGRGKPPGTADAGPG